MVVLSSCLACAGLCCRPDKDHCHIPALCLSPQQATKVAAHYQHHALLNPDGLPTLGTVADGQVATILSPTHTNAAPAETEQRLANVAALVDHITELSTTPQPGVRRHSAWRILTGAINQALSYDASVNGPGTTVPYGRRLDDLVLTTAARVIDEPNPTEATIRQLRLSRDEGGCGLRSAEQRCHTAFLSTVLRLRRTGPDRCAWLEQETAGALHGLYTMGIQLDANAMPHPTHTPLPNPLQPTFHFRHSPNANTLGG